MTARSPITLHTARTLYVEWNKRYKEASDRTKELKEKKKRTTDPKELAAIHDEIQELCIQANLIHQFLADVGSMVYADSEKCGG